VFLTIEDETGIANLVVRSDLFEKQRRVVLTAGMIAVTGRVQREGEVVHVIARTLTHFSPLLRSVSERGEASPAPHGQANRAKQADSPDMRPRSLIKLRTHDFR
jgi:error-prone DNA polymerase